MNKRHFMPNDFARFHPGGSLGRRLLTRLKDVMSQKLTKVSPAAPLKEVIVDMTRDQHGIALVMENENLVGVITDGDLRRAMLRHDFDFNTFKAKDIMSLKPITATHNSMLSDAEELMREHQIKQLLVIDDKKSPVGIIDFFN